MKPVPSSWHWKVAPLAPEKENDALVELVELGGCESIVGAGGGVVSMLHVNELTPLSLPAASRALTANVCVPSASAE